ncbi:hypothetical protein O9929_11105 [Vibrio lentus]|nr:hypothetical protein [Vibrio lentus]
MAAAIGEEKDTIEDVLEPYLIQQGSFRKEQLRGRIATDRAYLHSRNRQALKSLTYSFLKIPVA